MTYITGWRAVTCFGLLLLIAGCAPETGGRNGAITLNLGYFPNLTHAVALVGIGGGIFQRALGPQVLLHGETFNAGPIEMQALLADSIDIAFVGPGPAINGFLHSHGTGLRVIAGACSGGVFFIVRADEHIRDPADLAQKTIADPQRGGTQDVALRQYLQAHFLKSTDQGGNVQVLSTNNASILSLFKEGKLDGAWVPQPWATRMVLEAAGKVFLDERSLWPGGQFATTIVVVRQAFYNLHPDVVRRFLQADIDTVAYIRSNQAGSEQIASTQIKALTGLSMQRNEVVLASQSIQATYDPLVSTINQQADRLYAAGFLYEQPDLTHLYALDLLNDILAARGLATVATS